MTEVPVPAPAPTGVEAVDRVLDVVASLGDRPLSEHAAVLESAHADLRAALDDPAASAPDVAS